MSVERGLSVSWLFHVWRFFCHCSSFLLFVATVGLCFVSVAYPGYLLNFFLSIACLIIEIYSFQVNNIGSDNLKPNYFNFRTVLKKLPCNLELWSLLTPEISVQFPSTINIRFSSLIYNFILLAWFILMTLYIMAFFNVYWRRSASVTDRLHYIRVFENATVRSFGIQLVVFFISGCQCQVITMSSHPCFITVISFDLHVFFL